MNLHAHSRTYDLRLKTEPHLARTRAADVQGERELPIWPLSVLVWIAVQWRFGEASRSGSLQSDRTHSPAAQPVRIQSVCSSGDARTIRHPIAHGHVREHDLLRAVPAQDRGDAEEVSGLIASRAPARCAAVSSGRHRRVKNIEQRDAREPLN